MARMTADATLTSLLTGGVFTSGLAGEEGISRDTTPDAFDPDGYLQPCALVVQQGNIADGQVVDYDTQTISSIQRVEIWLYQDRGYATIDAAAARLRTLFLGHKFSDTFELWLANVIDRERDRGALNGASLIRQDWQVNSVLQV